MTPQFIISASSVLATTICFSLGLLTYLKDPNARLNRYFSLSNLFLGLWNISDVLYFIVPSEHHVFVCRFSYVWGALVTPFFLLFALELVGRQLQSRMAWGALAFSSLFFMAASFTPWLIEDVRISPHYLEVPGVLYPAFAINFLWSLIYATYHLLSVFLRADGTRKNQLKYVFTAYCFGIVGVSSFFIYVMKPVIPPLWYFLEICYTATIFYAIARHRLMDINLAFRNLTVHVIYVVLAGAPLVAALLWFRSVQASVFLVLAALLFGPVLLRGIRGRLTSAVDLLPPFRGKYDYLKDLDEQKERIASARSVDEWGRFVLDSVSGLFQPAGANVLVSPETGKPFSSPAASGPPPLSLPQESLLADKLRGKRKLIMRELLKAEYPSDEAERLGREMDALRAHLSVPFFVGGELKAVVNIGPKTDGCMYNELDVSAIWGLVNAAEVTLRALLLADEIVRKERFAAMGEIASVVGHEIRNALTAISHSAYLLESKLADASARRHLGVIGAQIASSQRIIGDILSCVRHRRLVLAKTSVNALLREAMSEAALPERISPLLKLSPALPDVLVDKDEMKHALFNLIRNAVEAMPQGGILRVESGLSASGGVRVSVEDSGCGIPAEEMGKIFTPLHSTKSNGTGLGLMVVKSVVGRHGGKVSVDSAVGRGTVFRIELPPVPLDETPTKEAYGKLAGAGR